MHKPLISVVMVICNVDRFLREAIESILLQTFEDFEFVIADFGSTDQSHNIALGYAEKDSRIKLHKIPACTLPEARNTACSFAQGQYIAIMDADDIALPDRLKLEFDFMEQHANVGVVGGAVEWITTSGDSIRTDYFPSDNQQIKAELKTRCAFCHPTVLLRTEAFVRAGQYRAAFTVAHDYDLWFRISEHFDCANLNSVVLKYRIHPYQVSMRKRTLQSVCILAAQASAWSRQEGRGDPLDEVREITDATLALLGVTKLQKESKVASELRQWIRHMCMAGEYSVALSAAENFLVHDLEYVENWQVADLYLTLAQLYRRNGMIFKSLNALFHAIAARPQVVGRPLKPLLRGH